jgi:DNA polymerase III subunit chi
MTQVDFYFNAQDRFQVACRLAGKSLAAGQRLLIYAPEAEVATRIDRTLWTWPATGFVPHCAAEAPLAAETPVLIAGDERSPEGFGWLLNLGAGCPPHFERFERLFEVVGADDVERNAGRERYRFYKSRGYAIANHDLAASADG